MTERTGEDEGRERIAERDREADMGERTQEYRRGEVTDGNDPLTRARAAAVEENSDHGSDQPPGVTPLEEEWQREKQMAGQDADDPGLPAGRRADADGHRSSGEGQDESAGRDDLVVPSGAGSSAGDREDPGTGTGSERMGKPERADELPDSGEVTQG